MLDFRRLWMVIVLAGGLAAVPARAQIDPVKRELVQLGYNQPVEGHGPIAAYAYYYYNQPDFLQHSNLTLRLAVAPVYLDSELAFSHLLGPQTDFAVGIAGGGFADSYYEIRKGVYYQSDSFTGNGGKVSASVYHRFNPDQQIPLTGVFRVEAADSLYERDDTTASNFVLPPDQPVMHVRTGFRWGGQEPVLAPDLAMELSAWYEGEFRLKPSEYGYADDRAINPHTHLFWGRALLAYTMEKSSNSFLVSLTAGTSVDADRFSAYRLGGELPLASEFPLTLPGYFYQELSAERFVLLNANYYYPLDADKRWVLTAVGTTSLMDYISGLNEPGHWNSGVGGGITYRAHSGAWQIFLGYSYGINAIRDGERGANSIGFLVQFNLERARGPLYDPGANNSWIHSFDHILRSFD